MAKEGGLRREFDLDEGILNATTWLISNRLGKASFDFGGAIRIRYIEELLHNSPTL